MAAVLSLLTSKATWVALACFGLLLTGFVLCWRWDHRGPKSFSETFSVASVPNGATIQARAGIFGRATRPVFIAGIAAPGLNDHLGPESRDNLAGLAGKTIRVESPERGILGRPLIGEVFGDAGADLGIAQLRAGLAKCETKATKDQIAAQREAQKAKRGLWESSGGSHWWHFSVAQAAFPDPKPLETETETPMLETIGLWLEIAVALIVLFWIAAYFLSPYLSKSSAGSAAVKAIDTSEQLAAYAALTLIRYTPAVAADPVAIGDCEYLRTVSTGWKNAPSPPQVATGTKT